MKGTLRLEEDEMIDIVLLHLKNKGIIPTEVTESQIVITDDGKGDKYTYLLVDFETE